MFPAWDDSFSRIAAFNRRNYPVEYTDAPSSEPSVDEVAKTRNGRLESAEGTASDAVAVMLSVIPGLGHVYKGYKMLGLIFVAGAFAAVLIGALAATATAGFGLALIPIYWIGVMVHVWAIDDRVEPAKTDQGEEY
jgi:hypothetical protein